MKYTLLLICCFGLLMSCTQDLDTPLESFSEDTTVPNFSRMSGIQKAYYGVMNRSFKEDYMSSKREGEIDFGPLTTDFLAKLTDYGEEYIHRYPKAKAAMLSHSEETQAIQRISLKYLRLYFIPRTDETSLVETEFLLDLIVENNGIDLDVMADAYVKVAHRLMDEKKLQYLTHFERVYNDHMSGIYEDFEKQKNIYFTTDDKEEKFWALFAGKGLERKSKAAIYARDLLNLNVTTHKF